MLVNLLMRGWCRSFSVFLIKYCNSCFIDYRFLEEANRVSDNALRDKKNKQKFLSKNVSDKLKNIIC